MSEWQPIETAPKDVAILLLFPESGVTQGKFDVLKCADGRVLESWKPLWLEQHGCGCCGGIDTPPTHWMPLPSPPEKEKPKTLFHKSKEEQ